MWMHSEWLLDYKPKGIHVENEKNERKTMKTRVEKLMGMANKPTTTAKANTWNGIHNFDDETVHVFAYTHHINEIDYLHCIYCP